jgi:cysteine desulfurase
LRAGTEDVAQVVGFTEALEIARATADAEHARLKKMQELFFGELEKIGNQIGIIRVNGSRMNRICNNVNISVAGISGERLVIELDARGICASSKSACREDAGEESHVIAALRRAQREDVGGTEAVAENSTQGSLRFSMGRDTKKTDVLRAAKRLAKVIGRISQEIVDFK